MSDAKVSPWSGIELSAGKCLNLVIIIMCDMSFCFNINCPYLYSHLYVCILCNVVVYVKKKKTAL